MSIVGAATFSWICERRQCMQHARTVWALNVSNSRFDRWHVSLVDSGEAAQPRNNKKKRVLWALCPLIPHLNIYFRALLFSIHFCTK
jgi:hypothetical protein